jgi:hypothetical protein
MCEKPAFSGWQPEGRRPWGWLALVADRSLLPGQAIAKLRLVRV